MSRRFHLDSEIEEIMYLLRDIDLSFLGQRAYDLAEELSLIIEEHVEATYNFIGFGTNDLAD